MTDSRGPNEENLPEWVLCAVKLLKSDRNRIRSTFTREEKKDGHLAGYTCKDCPFPWRSHETYRIQMIDEESIPSERLLEFKHTVRCTECGRLMKRFQRAKKKVEMLKLAKRHANQTVKFVTLTMKNYEGSEPKVGVREMKKLVSTFRSTDEFRKIIVGGFDFFEWTHNHDDGTYNIHSHSLWIMPYWKQADLQRAWEMHIGADTAIVHIKRLGDAYQNKDNVWCKGDAEKDALWYSMKYGGKDAVKGIRLAESFGICRGRAYAELELIAEQEKELFHAEGVVGYEERLSIAIENEGPISSVEYIHLEDIIILSNLRLFLPIGNN